MNRKIVLTLIASSIFALLIAEGIARLVFPPVGETIGKDKVLGWRPRANLLTHHKDPDTGEFRVVKTDENGYRNEPMREKTDKVVILGDSMTFGIYVAQEDIVSSRLSQLLGEATQVLNVSAPGWGSQQELIALEELIPTFHPKKVIWVFTPVNDVVDNLLDHMMFSPAFKRPVFDLDVEGRLARRPFNEYKGRPVCPRFEPRLYQLAYKVYKRLDPNNQLTVGAGEDGSNESSDKVYSPAAIYLEEPPEPLLKGMKVTAAILAAARGLCEESGAGLSLVAFDPGQGALPADPIDRIQSHGWDPDLFSTSGARENLENIARMAGVEMSYYTTPATGTFERDGHLNVAGHSDFAEFLYRSVFDLNLRLLDPTPFTGQNACSFPLRKD